MPDLNRPIPRQTVVRARAKGQAGLLGSGPGTRVTDQMIDQVMELRSEVQAWSRDTWASLAHTAGDSSQDYRDPGREFALSCAIACGRGRIIASATRALLGDLPPAVTPAALQALSDAVLAMLLADIVPALTYAILTRPVHVAARSGRRPIPGRARAE